MKQASNKWAESLGEWLALATFGLAEPASKRIKQEIQAHYADAVANCRADGISEQDAEASALQDLGDPKEAWEVFRSRYLTEHDYRGLQKLEDSYRELKSPRHLGFLLFHIGYAVLGWYLCSDNFLRIVLIMMATSVLLSWLIALCGSYWTRTESRRTVNLKRWLVLHIIENLIGSLGVLLFSVLLNIALRKEFIEGIWPEVLVFVLISFVLVSVAFRLRTWILLARKLKLTESCDPLYV